jgi:hypothetical protein
VLENPFAGGGFHLALRLCVRVHAEAAAPAEAGRHPAVRAG